MLSKRVIFSALKGSISFANCYSGQVKCIHTSTCFFAYNKQLLSKLRKKTGFPIVKCRNALEKFDNLEEAEKWLHEQAKTEGWSRATKLQSRPMSSGVIGVLQRENVTALVEVNCETDFVARNEAFQKVVLQAANACVEHSGDSSSMKTDLSGAALAALAHGPHTLADTLALTIGNIGENMRLRRAVVLRNQGEVKAACYIHTSGVKGVLADPRFAVGQYGSAVLFKHPQQKRPDLPSGQLGRELAQHVVGMKPLTLGTWDDVTQSRAKPTDTPAAEDTPAESAEPAEEESGSEGLLQSSDGRMLLQPFLMDDSVTVAELLEENGADLLDFVRLECGELLPGEEDEDEPQTQAAQA